MTEPTSAVSFEDKEGSFETAGEWWKLRHWHDPAALHPVGVTEKEVHAALDILKAQFSGAWFLQERDRVDRHPALACLASGGTSDMGCALELSAAINAASRARAGSEHFLAHLREPERFWATLAEGKFARYMVNENLDFSFEVPPLDGGPRPDLTAHHGSTPFNVEVTTLTDRWYEGPIAVLMDRVMFELPRRLPNRKFSVELVGDLVQLLPGLTTDRVPDSSPDKDLARALADELIDHAGRQAASEAGEFSFDLAYVGRCRIGPDGGSPGGSSGVSGPPMDPKSIVRRIALTSLAKAMRQLPLDSPSVVAVGHGYGSVDYEFASSSLSRLMASQGPALEHLSGIVLFTTAPEGGGLHDTLFPIANPMARVQARALPWGLMTAPSRRRCY